jgi:hypothetical protein
VKNRIMKVYQRSSNFFLKNMRRSPLPIVSDEPEFHVPLCIVLFHFAGGPGCAHLCEVLIYSFLFPYLLFSLVILLAASMKGTHLFDHTKGSLWRRIQAPFNHADVHIRDSALARRSLRLIVIRPLIPQHRIANQQQLMSSRSQSNPMASSLGHPTVHPSNS